MTSTGSKPVRQQNGGLRWGMTIRRLDGGPLIQATVSFYDELGDTNARTARFLAIAGTGRHGGPPGLAVLLPSAAEYVSSGDCIPITGAELIVLHAAVVEEIRNALADGRLSLPAGTASASA